MDKMDKIDKLITGFWIHLETDKIKYVFLWVAMVIPTAIFRVIQSLTNKHK